MLNRPKPNPCGHSDHSGCRCCPRAAARPRAAQRAAQEERQEHGAARAAAASHRPPQEVPARQAGLSGLARPVANTAVDRLRLGAARSAACAWAFSLRMAERTHERSKPLRLLQADLHCWSNGLANAAMVWLVGTNSATRRRSRANVRRRVQRAPQPRRACASAATRESARRCSSSLLRADCASEFNAERKPTQRMTKRHRHCRCNVSGTARGRACEHDLVACVRVDTADGYLPSWSASARASSSANCA